MLQATMPLDAQSKLGGPCPGVCQNRGDQTDRESNWPYCNVPKQGLTPSSSPIDWWRWALLIVRPTDSRTYWLPPQIPSLHSLGQIFGGWQLFRHVKTQVQIMATRAEGSFSPVASIKSQDMYLWRRQGYGAWKQGQQPCTGGQITSISGGTRNFDADEGIPPSEPPQYRLCASYSGPQVWDYCAINNSEKTDYSNECFMSFATITALGGQWSFPPGQRSVSRRTFNHHTVSHQEDPQGRRWNTLVPINKEWINDGSMESSEINKTIAVIYLAQGTNISPSYKFGTFTEQIETTPMVNRIWAIARIKSQWQLGNHRRPWLWDVNWSNTTGSY